MLSFRRIVFLLLLIPLLSIWTIAKKSNNDVIYSAKYLINVQKLVDDINCKNRDFRLEAVRRLGELKDRRYIPLLQEALNDNDSRVVTEAIKALSTFKDPAIVQSFFRIINAPVSKRRSYKTGEYTHNQKILAIGGLTKIGGKRVIRFLRELTGNNPLNNEAILALAKLDIESSAKIIIDKLNKQDRDSIYLGRLIDVIREKKPSRFFEPLFDLLVRFDIDAATKSLRRRVILALAHIDAEKALQKFQQGLNSPDLNLRLKSIEAFGFVKNKPSFKSLFDILLAEKWEKSNNSSNKYLNTLEQSLTSTFEKNDTQAQKLLLQALEHENPKIRKIALSIIGAAKLPLSEKRRTKLQKNQEKYPPISVAIVLATLNDFRSIEPLLQSAETGKGLHQSLLIRKITDPRATGILIKALSHKNSHIRSAAAAALGNIKNPKAIPHLIETLSDENMRVSLNSAQALYNINDYRVVKPLIRLASIPRPVDRYRLKWSTLTNRLIDAALAVLGKITDQNAIDVLFEGLKRGNREIQRRIIKSLEQINHSEVENRFKQLLDSHSPVLKEIAAHFLAKKEFPPAIEVLVSFLEQPHRQLKAAITLAAIKDKRAIPVLVKIIKERRSTIERDELSNYLNLKDSTVDGQLWRPFHKDPSKIILKSAIEALIHMNIPEASEHLIPLVEDINYRIIVIDYMGKIKEKRAVGLLIQRLKNDLSLPVRQSALEALKKISGKNFNIDIKAWKNWSIVKE